MTGPDIDVCTLREVIKELRFQARVTPRPTLEQLADRWEREADAREQTRAEIEKARAQAVVKDDPPHGWGV